MNIGSKEKNICCFLAAIILFLGMSVDISGTDSSFLCNSHIVNTTNETLQSLSAGFSEPVACTLNMISAGAQTMRAVANGTTFRGQTKAQVTVFFVGAYFLYRSIYQSSESKEDGQLFLCRSIIVDYIHQKDSGE